jgi:(E)-4-hydroxy-3-methylbut-2-enyl-diphosphate synthase
VRLAIPDKEAAAALPAIVRQVDVPIIADIHFDYQLALLSLKAGVHKLRINLGNIGSKERVEKVLNEAKARGIPVRIGINAGSLEKDLLEQCGGPTAEALVKSAIRQVEFCEEIHFDAIVLSLKASNILATIEAYRKISKAVDYPLHVGITEAGTKFRGSIKSAVGIGTLLAEGIGDTIRVSLTGNPVDELEVAYEILKSLGLRQHGISFISCPTCGRVEVDLVAIAEEVEHTLNNVNKNITVAIMGCAVNGPGEAREADIGIACGKNSALLFKKGEIVEKIPESEIVARLVAEVRSWKV